MPRDRDAELPVPVPPAQGERVEWKRLARLSTANSLFERLALLDVDAIDPQTELDRQHALAFNASGRASGSPPARHPGPVRGFQSKSLRRVP